VLPPPRCQEPSYLTRTISGKMRPYDYVSMYTFTNQSSAARKTLFSAWGTHTLVSTGNKTFSTDFRGLSWQSMAWIPEPRKSRSGSPILHPKFESGNLITSQTHFCTLMLHKADFNPPPLPSPPNRIQISAKRWSGCAPHRVYRWCITHLRLGI
jgi:hypothetical protein